MMASGAESDFNMNVNSGVFNPMEFDNQGY